MKRIAKPNAKSNLRSPGDGRKYLMLGVFSSILTAFFLNSGVLAQETSEPAPLVNTKIHIYLLIGQSNMAGRGELDKESTQIHPNILMFTEQNQWVPAFEPLHFDRKNAGAGLGASFARTMAEAHPGATIGLVPCAVGGTPLSRWQKGGDLYQQSIDRLRLAIKDGIFRGVLWQQGESDALDIELAANYAVRLSGLIADLRTEFAAPDVPFVAGKLGEFSLTEKNGKHYHWKIINEQLVGLTKLIANVAVVESTGLTHKGDFVHFDTPALRTLGHRYAEVMLALQSKSAPPIQSDKSTADMLLPLTSEFESQLGCAQEAGLIEIVPVHLPSADAGPCNHYGWPIATTTGNTIVVMHRRIPGHNPTGIMDQQDNTMSYGVVLRSEDGGKTWSKPYDLRDCMKPEDRNRGGLVPLSHRFKWDETNSSMEGYKVNLHAIGTTRDGSVVAINNHGVFRSDDAGRTWKHFSTALRDDTFPQMVNIGPRILDLPEVGLVVFGNWFSTNPRKLIEEGLPQRFVALYSPDGGETWNVEEFAVGFPQYEPAALQYEGQLLFITRDQTKVLSHKQLSWQTGQQPQIIDTNLEDPRFVDTVDFSFNPVTKRFEIVRSERYRMELWLWSMDPTDWETGQWRRECRLLAREGDFYRDADGFHPAGAVIDEKRGVQHVFIYSGDPNGPAGVFRITRTLDTPKLVDFLGEKTNPCDTRIVRWTGKGQSARWKNTGSWDSGVPGKHEVALFENANENEPIIIGGLADIRHQRFIAGNHDGTVVIQSSNVQVAVERHWYLIPSAVNEPVHEDYSAGWDGLLHKNCSISRKKEVIYFRQLMQ